MNKSYDEFAYEMAVKEVCPYSLNPVTIYEQNAVKHYQAFVMRVVAEYCRIQLLEDGIDYSWEEKMASECDHKDIVRICLDCGETFE